MFILFASAYAQTPVPADKPVDTAIVSETDRKMKVPAVVEVPKDVPAPVKDAFSYEITVHGESAIRQARWDVVTAMKREGWEPRERGGETVFKPPRRWMGKADLDELGNLDFRYPILKFQQIDTVETNLDIDENPNFQRSRAGYAAVGDGDFRLPAARAGLWSPSKRKLDTWYSRTVVAVQPEIERLQRIQRDTEVKAQIDRVPDRLDALWKRGVAIDGGGLVAEEDRTEAILTYWGTRADTFEGRQTTKVIETWIRNVLVDTPLTDDQIRRAVALRADGRKLQR